MRLDCTLLRYTLAQNMCTFVVIISTYDSTNVIYYSQKIDTLHAAACNSRMMYSSSIYYLLSLERVHNVIETEILIWNEVCRFYLLTQGTRMPLLERLKRRN